MRELTNAEKGELDRRRAGFEQFRNESMPVLVDFVIRLGLPDPPAVLVEAERYLGAIDAFMTSQVIGSEDRVWILTRLGYYIGELLIQRFSGHWFVNEIPDSRYFLHYVVGRFAHLRNPNAMVDPFHVADAYLAEVHARSLASIVNEVFNELRQS